MASTVTARPTAALARAVERRDGLKLRMQTLDQALDELRTLRSQAEARTEAWRQEHPELAPRLGSPPQPTAAEAFARQVLGAMHTEVGLVRQALSRVEAEAERVRRELDAVSGLVDRLGVEQRQEEADRAERERLIGAVGWSARAAEIVAQLEAEPTAAFAEHRKTVERLRARTG